MVDQDLAEVVPTPFVEGFAEEIPPVFRVHRPVGHDGIWMVGPGLRLPVPGQGVVVPLVGCRLLEALVFDDRNELHVGGADLIPKKAVNVQRLSSVVTVDTGQGVERNSEPLEKLDCVEDLVERGPPALRHAVLIMELARAIDA